ncbi:6062_t:CDS:2, partial [Gigaspora margarita]
QFDLLEQSNTIEISNIFIENIVNIPAILIKKLIPSIEIDSILEYVDKKQLKPESQTWLYPFLIGEAYTKVNYYKTYTTVNRLLKKAIQAGLDTGSTLLQNIHQIRKIKNKKQQIDENNTISNYSSSNKDVFIIENLVFIQKEMLQEK